MDRKKLMYIGIILIITVILSVTYFSYAFFTSTSEQHGKLNVVVGTLDYKIESDDLTDNAITLAANEKKQISIKITSLNNVNSKYELYYEGSNVTVQYLPDGDTPVGTINANANKTISIKIKNPSNSPVTVLFKVDGGFAGKDLVINSDNHISLGASCDYDAGYVWDFDYTGSYQEFEVPCDGDYKLEAWGAQGGEYNNTYSGGKGAYTSGIIELNEDEPLYIYVGEFGKCIYNATVSSWNGSTAWSQVTRQALYMSCTGGGATDYRIVETSSKTVWDEDNSLKSRIMVAGAGGGGYYWRENSEQGGAGGYGGALVGGDGINIPSTISYPISTGGTQLNGGQWSGEFGKGGSRGYYYASHPSYSFSNNYGWCFSAGGSGYYGGGASYHVNAGAGGSSYISGHKGCVAIESVTSLTPRKASDNATQCTATIAADDIKCSEHYSGRIFTNTVIKAGNESMPNPRGTGDITGNTGNGYARITYLGN